MALPGGNEPKQASGSRPCAPEFGSIGDKLIGGLIRFVVAIWILIAGIIAIRQALDFSTGKAILTAVLGWLAIVIPMALIGLSAAGMRALM